MRNTLVTALVACADRPKKLVARRFLLGLSSDELQFIAEYLGARIIECEERCARNQAALTERSACFERPPVEPVSADRELKMILLREYLCHAGVPKVPLPSPRQVVN